MKKELRGLHSALLVSFDKKGNINEKGTREIIRHNIDVMKVDGLYVGGSTGENFLLSNDDKRRIFEIAKDEVKNEVKLIAQVGSSNVYEAIELGNFVTELGYDAISAVPPFYYKFTSEEVFDYYDMITSHVDNDLIIYSIPALTGLELSLDDFAHLFENDKIIGVKYTQTDLFLLERIRKAFPEKLIFYGVDEMFLSASMLNIDGGIGSTYNVLGPRYRDILHSLEEGNIEEAYNTQSDINDVIEAVIANGLYGTLKELLSLYGVEKSSNRKPMRSITDEEVDKAKDIFEKYLK